MAPNILARRKMLGLLGSAGAAALIAGCNGGSSGSSTATTTTSSSTTSDSSSDDSSSSSGDTTSSCVADPEETNGPYPGDGSNSVNGSTVNVLTDSGIIRSDITSSFGSYSGTADGVPVVLNIQLVDVNNGCTALDGYVIYLWHCNAEGKYSLYSSGVQNVNYLRGVQEADSDGNVSFTTIFPGCYDGRWPHMHFEIFSSLAEATQYGNRVLCSQFAMPSDAASTLYSNVSEYSDSVSNFNRISISSDNVFGDNSSAEITAMTPTVDSGNYVDGYEMSIVVGISA
ncbi:intradiol ring-cleavage dioxygenase [Emcibacter nanhaiensis]|uniref:Intradiol ring-cleavage dioxygenase n=2 Tax=Emcibacter nanhaiensis TaxID=1505037 RepID=A0A501PIE6_9PROT|nr:intradiol ring-cleavage dioxygenase [Emcibacter nanhaiensis]